MDVTIKTFTQNYHTGSFTNTLFLVPCSCQVDMFLSIYGMDETWLEKPLYSSTRSFLKAKISNQQKSIYCPNLQICMLLTAFLTGCFGGQRVPPLRSRQDREYIFTLWSWSQFKQWCTFDMWMSARRGALATALPHIVLYSEARH